MARVPKERDRPYDTTEPTGLNEAISKLFATRGYGRPQANRELRELWSKVAGDEFADSTRVLGLKNGVLQIGVENSALLSELHGFHRVELLRRLKSEGRRLRVRDLKFSLSSRPAETESESETKEID